MNAWCRSARALACAVLAVAGTALAAPRAVEAFGTETWQSLRASIKQPTVVVFTATWCASCPAVMADLVGQMRQRKVKASVLVVVMDVAPGDNDAALVRNPHYRLADRLWAFDGQAPAIRYQVDPRWRGAAPFVALLSPHAAPRLSTGMPADADLAAWAAATR